MFERIEKNGILYAEVIWKDFSPEKTRFMSSPERSFQFGVVAHEAGYEEPPHDHKKIERVISDLQQAIFVISGKLLIRFFIEETGEEFENVTLGPGDAICLVHGPHSISTLERVKCLSVKQGPFRGDENDKIILNNVR
jgi:hypothetical protein